MNQQCHLLFQLYNAWCSIYNQKNIGNLLKHSTTLQTRQEPQELPFDASEMTFAPSDLTAHFNHNFYSSSFLFLVNLSFYSMEYARITSTIGARHNGHFPPPRTNSFAHFEQVHMCPHLQKVTVFKGRNTTNNKNQHTLRTENNKSCSKYWCKHTCTRVNQYGYHNKHSKFLSSHDPI